MSGIQTVCVFAGSAHQVPDSFMQAASRLGRLLADNAIGVVNGAGSTGLMEACADACLGGGGVVTGVIPRFMVENGWQHDKLSKLIVTENMHTRKQTMHRLSDGFIALPGGCGTMEELMEAITWKQLRLHQKPVVLLNTDGFYDGLIGMLDKAVDCGFMRYGQMLWSVAATPEEAVSLLRTADDGGGDKQNNAASRT